MTDTEIAKTLRRIVPEHVAERLTRAQKQDVVDVYRVKPGTIAAICQKSLHANSPYNYFVGSIARVLDQISQEPQPRQPRRPHEQVDCKDCADTGFVSLHTGDSAPCHCPLGQQKQARYGTTHYTRDDYEPVVVDGPLVTLHEYAQSEAGKNDPHLPAFLRMLERAEQEAQL